MSPPKSKPDAPCRPIPPPPGVMLYLNFYENLKPLDDATLGALLRALMEYVSCGVVPEFQGSAAGCWLFVKQYIDRDILRYQQVVERRRKAAEKRWAKERESAAGSTDTSAAEGAPWMKRYLKPPHANDAK